MRPLEGAESDGAFGFFKGVGKGIAGFVQSSSSLKREFLTEEMAVLQSGHKTSGWSV